MRNFLKKDALVVRLEKVCVFLEAFASLYPEKGDADLSVPHSVKLRGLAHPLKSVLEKVSDEDSRKEIKRIAKEKPWLFFNKMREAACDVRRLQSRIRESLVDGVAINESREFLKKMDFFRKVLRTETFALKENPASRLAEAMTHVEGSVVEQKLDKAHPCLDTNVERMMGTLKATEDMLLLESLFAEED